jgi:7,8-dihydropterin-6-yl-methyl-4-(beta-D-ribofuranosyl)aminobenzene 5'-phosphate synthase
MNIRILYDNEAEPGFCSGWGFAALIDDETLFDTGENAESLLANMRAFGADPARIRRVVLSHNDWDHVGGIAILARCPGATVCLPAGASDLRAAVSGLLDANGRVLDIRDSVALAPGLRVTGRMGLLKKEIALVLQAADGLVVLTGCAHPGLDTILQHAAQYGTVHAVIGGFHGFSRLDALADIPCIVPCHCTRRKAEILARYPGQARPCRAGTTLHFADAGETP